jgi:hypothetical protein
VALGVVALAPSPASAELVLNLGTVTNGTGPSTGSNWVQLKFDDHSDNNTIAAGDVKLTITVSGTPSGIFTDSLGFNVTPTSLLNLTFTHESGPSVELQSGNPHIVQSATGTYPGSGNQLGDVGLYNIAMYYTTANNSGRLNATNGPSVYLLSASSALSDSSFDVKSHPAHSGGATYYAAAHLMGYTPGNSSGIVATNVNPVPEPSTIFGASLSVAGAVLYGVRRRKA